MGVELTSLILLYMNRAVKSLGGRYNESEFSLLELCITHKQGEGVKQSLYGYVCIHSIFVYSWYTLVCQLRGPRRNDSSVTP